MKILSSVFLLVMWLGAGSVSAGVNGSGGGNFCWVDGKPRVKDLAGETGQALYQKNKGERKTPLLVATPLMDRMGFDSVQIPDGPWQDVIHLHLSRLKTSAPKLHELMVNALQSVSFFVTNVKFQHPIETQITGQSVCTPENMRAGILYFGGFAFISLPDFNQLDDFSIATILLHESLRHIQFGFSAETSRGSNLALEDLTLSILLDLPGLDEHDFIKKYFNSLGEGPSPRVCEAWKVADNDPMCSIAHLGAGSELGLEASLSFYGKTGLPELRRNAELEECSTPEAMALRSALLMKREAWNRFLERENQ